MDILLVNAPVKSVTRQASLALPLGLAYIASVLLENGYDVSAIDFNASSFDLVRARRVLENESPQVLGISSVTRTYLSGLKLAQIAKQVNPDIKVVMGGPHVTVMYEEVMREKSIDVVVRGEGEYAMLELANYLIRNKGSLAKINGVVYKEEGLIKKTPERPFIENPDELPFPARELFPIPLYEIPGQVIMSRGGCPFNCHFCAVNNIWKGGRRYRSPENVLKEILYILNNFQLEEISFADDTFTLNREHVIRLCSLLKNVGKDFSWRWRCATRVDLVDEGLLMKMYEAGCYSIQFGVEAGSQKILDSTGKGITLGQVRDAVSKAISVGMEVVCFFMFPHPEDTEVTIREQKQFMKELVKMGVETTISSTTLYPGTYYYKNKDELGVKILADNWDEYDAGHLSIATRYLSEERLKDLLDDMIQDVRSAS